MESQTIDQIKADYPDQWVLIGNPELALSNTLGSVRDKLMRGTVLFASKDRREIGYKARSVRDGFESVTCIYTGHIPQNRKWLL